MPDAPDNPPPSPSSFLELVAARVERLHESAPALLRGVPVKTSSTSREYGGFVYAQVRDPGSGDSVDAKVPSDLAARLEWGREAVLVGLVRYRVKRGEVRPEFRIDSVQQAGEARIAGRPELLERFARFTNRPRRDAAALQGKRPRVALVTGVGSVAVDDVRAQLRETEADLELEVVRVPVTRPAAVAEALRAAGGADLVALSRGGGEGLRRSTTRTC